MSFKKRPLGQEPIKKLDKSELENPKILFLNFEKSLNDRAIWSDFPAGGETAGLFNWRLRWFGWIYYFQGET